MAESYGASPAALRMHFLVIFLADGQILYMQNFVVTLLGKPQILSWCSRVGYASDMFLPFFFNSGMPVFAKSFSKAIIWAYAELLNWLYSWTIALASLQSHSYRRNKEGGDDRRETLSSA